MMRKSIFWQIITGLVLIFTITSCDPDPLAEEHLAPSFGQITAQAYQTEASIECSIPDIYGSYEAGVYLSQYADMDDRIRLSGYEEIDGKFVFLISDLTPSTFYYYQVFISNLYGDEVVSDIFSFQTSELTLAVLETSDVNDITANSAVSGGTVISDGGSDVTRRGVCWSSINMTPNLSGSHSDDGSGVGSFVSELTGLTGNTEYYVRSYAVNSMGISYGPVITFTTLPGESDVWSLIGCVNGAGWDTDFDMTETGSGVWESETVVINSYFKLRQNHSWDVSRGGTFVSYNVPFPVSTNNADIILPDADVTCVVRYNSNDETVTVIPQGDSYTLDDYIGSYSLSCTMTSGAENWSGVTISRITDPQSGGPDVFISGLFHGYSYMPVWGRWDESQNCILLQGGYHSTSILFHFTSNPDLNYYAVFAPVYCESSETSYYLNGGDNGWGEAKLVRNSDGSLSYQGSVPDDNGRVANGFRFLYYLASTNEYTGEFGVCWDISLSPAASSSSTDSEPSENIPNRAVMAKPEGGVIKTKITPDCIQVRGNR